MNYYFNFICNRTIPLVSLFLMPLAHAGFDHLQNGDLIFFMDSCGAAEHVGIYAGTKKGIPQISHAVAGRHHAIITSALHAADFPYIAYRNKNFTLALSAAYRIHSWSIQQIPYDDAAAELMNQMSDDRRFCHPKTGTAALYAYAQSMSIPNFPRRVKYASRRSTPTLPADPVLGSTGRGLRCDEAAILAYQTEELLALDAVHSVDSIFGEGGWISDKYTSDEILDEVRASPAYRAYQARLASSDEYPVKQNKKLNAEHTLFYPSTVAWNFEKFGPIENFARDFDTALPLDSKITNPNVLLHHVTQDSSHWDNIGPFTIDLHPLSEEDKAQYREKTQSVKTHAALRRERSLSSLHSLHRTDGPAGPASCECTAEQPMQTAINKFQPITTDVRDHLVKLFRRPRHPRRTPDPVSPAFTRLHLDSSSTPSTAVPVAGTETLPLLEDTL